MISRITQLIEMHKEDEQSTINSKSLFDMLVYFDEHFYFDKPSIVITPAGNFRCGWSNGNYFFFVEFCGDEIISYVLFVRLISGNILRMNDVSDIEFIGKVFPQLNEDNHVSSA